MEKYLQYIEQISHICEDELFSKKSSYNEKKGLVYCLCTLMFFKKSNESESKENDHSQEISNGLMASYNVIKSLYDNLYFFSLWDIALKSYPAISQALS